MKMCNSKKVGNQQYVVKERKRSFDIGNPREDQVRAVMLLEVDEYTGSSDVESCRDEMRHCHCCLRKSSTYSWSSALQAGSVEAPVDRPTVGRAVLALLVVIS